MQSCFKVVPRRRGPAFGALILALFLALPAAGAQDLSCGQGDVEVLALRFVGNKAFPKDELALHITTTPSSKARRTLRLPWAAKRCLNRAYLPLDLYKLQLFYLDRGYYSAKIDTVIAPMGRAAVSVTFRITEGPVTTLKSYTIQGLEGVEGGPTLIRSLRLKTGGPFSLGLLIADRDTITSRLRNSGYYHATTLSNYERRTDSLSAVAEIIVAPGPRTRFAKPVVQVTPLDGRDQEVPDAVVQQVIGISAGAWYSDHAINDAQRSLYQLGMYRHVEVAPLPDSLQPAGDSSIVLAVRLSEDYPRRVDSEYGWATLDCFRIRAQYTDLNFLRAARRFELTGQASKIGVGSPLASTGTRNVCTLNGQSPLASDTFSTKLQYYGGVAFRQPQLLGTRWVPTVSLYSERRGEYKAYLRTTKIGADASALRDFGGRTQLRIGYAQEYGRTEAPDAVLCALFSRCDEETRADIQKFATLGVLSASLTRIRTDNLVSPTRGTVMRAELRSSAARFLGTSPSLFFNKASAELTSYAPLGSSVLSLRLRGGIVQGASATAFIPPQERLYAGGATSIRGFQQNELGDVVYIARVDDVIRADTLGTPHRLHVADTGAVGFERVVPLGGNTLLVANLEYRVRDPFLFPNRLQYTFFVDAGDAWNRDPGDAWNLMKHWDPKLTPGFGLRLLTDIGPIQVNFGFSKYKRPAGRMYFEDPLRVASSVRPDISPLYCVSPGNTIDLERRDGVLQPPAGSVCPPSYSPPQKRAWRVAFTFSIGPDF